MDEFTSMLLLLIVQSACWDGLVTKLFCLTAVDKTVVTHSVILRDRNAFSRIVTLEKYKYFAKQDRLHTVYKEKPQGRGVGAGCYPN